MLLYVYIYIYIVIRGTRARTCSVNSPFGKILAIGRFAAAVDRGGILQDILLLLLGPSADEQFPDEHCRRAGRRVRLEPAPGKYCFVVGRAPPHGCHLRSSGRAGRRNIVRRRDRGHRVNAQTPQRQLSPRQYPICTRTYRSTRTVCVRASYTNGRQLRP